MTAPAHSLLGVLAWLDAPAAVRDWVAGHPLAEEPIDQVEDWSPLTESAPSASAVLWPLVAIGVHLDRIATALALLLEERASPLGDQQLLDALELALAVLEDPSRGARAAKRAQKIERLAAEVAPSLSGYRGTTHPRTDTTLAIARLLQGCEALGGFRARTTLERKERAVGRASSLGLGGVLGAASLTEFERVTPASLARPLALDRPPPPELLYAAEAFAAALTELERSSAPSTLRDALLAELDD